MLKPTSKMFKILISTQTDNHNLRKHVVTNRSYILRKNALKIFKLQLQHLLQNSNFIREKISGYITVSFNITASPPLKFGQVPS